MKIHGKIGGHYRNQVASSKGAVYPILDSKLESVSLALRQGPHSQIHKSLAGCSDELSLTSLPSESWFVFERLLACGSCDSSLLRGGPGEAPQENETQSATKCERVRSMKHIKEQIPNFVRRLVLLPKPCQHFGHEIFESRKCW